jgi:hypothetical protein
MDQEFLKRFNDKVKEAIDKALEARREDDRQRVMTTVGQDIAKMLAPFLNQVATTAKSSKDDLREAMFEILGQVNAKDLNIDTKPLVDAIESAMMNVRIPEPKVTITLPADLVKLPDFPTEMGVRGFQELMGIFRDSNNPISVQLRDRKGNPIDLSSLGSSAIGGGGGSGGKADFFTIKDIRGSSASLIDQTEGALRVVGSFTASVGSTYATLANPDGGITAANPLPVQIASGSTSGTQYDDAGNSAPGTGPLVIAKNSSDSTYALRVGSGDSATALRTVQAADSVSSTFITDTAKALEVLQVSGSVHSTNILQVNGSAVVVGTGYQDNALRVVNATDAITSTNMTQVAGSAVVVGTGYQDNALRVVQATDAIASTNLMQVAGSATVVGGGWKDNALRVVEAQDSVTSSNIMQVNGSGVVVGTGYQDNALRVVHATDAVASVFVTGSSGTLAANIVDSTGVAYSGSNPVPITGSVSVTGSITSTVVTGPSVGGTADDGTAPVQVGLIARTTNPATTAGGSVVKASADAIGRQIMRPVQARGLIATSYNTLTTGTEATMVTAAAGTYLDLIQVMAANSSDAAVIVDIRPVSGGNVIASIAVPANGTAGISCSVPMPQQDTGNAWTIDMPDITGTTVYVTALFSKEV